MSTAKSIWQNHPRALPALSTTARFALLEKFTARQELSLEEKEEWKRVEERVHKICENYLNNEEDFARKTMPDSVAMFKSLQPLLDEHVNNIHALEIPLYSHHLKVAGRVDCIAEYDGKLSIIDFKTSGKLKEESWIKGYFMQCSAYAVMYEERTGIPVSQIVIMIAVDSEHPQVFIKKRNDYIKDFIAYREAYDAVLID